MKKKGLILALLSFVGVVAVMGAKYSPVKAESEGNITASEKEYEGKYSAVFRDSTEEESKIGAAYFARGKDAGNITSFYNGLGTTYMYAYDDGSTFVNHGDYMMFYTVNSTKRRYNLYISGYPKGAFPVTELEDFSLTKAIVDVRDACEKLGIAVNESEPLLENN